jgi:opacity protein-like surface antigen
MKKLAVTVLLHLCVLLPATAFAEVEDWYTYWAIGFADHDYPGDLNAVIDAVDAIPGVDRTETAIDMFGFYWPYNNNTMLGFVISGSYDRLEDNYDNYTQINHYLYGLSAMHFFGHEIGDGFYVRGDAGIAKMTFDSNITPDLESDNGTGFLFGFGYAWPISEQSRLMLGMNLSSRDIEGDNVSSTSFVIGGLW